MFPDKYLFQEQRKESETDAKICLTKASRCSIMKMREADKPVSGKVSTGSLVPYGQGFFHAILYLRRVL